MSSWRTIDSSTTLYCASIFSMPSWLRRMSSTRSWPMNAWFSGNRNDSLGCCSVSVVWARTMLARTLYVLSSVIRPDGTSMLTTSAGDALIYFTNEAKPPASGLLSPDPNSPSTTTMSASSFGGSNSSVTSTNCFSCFTSCSRCLLAAQSADRRPLMLNRKALTA